METKGIDLTKCNNCRIKVRARYYDGEEYAATGRIFTMRDGAVFVESDNEEGDIELFCDGKISDEIVDFEIVPRDPETYRDWQVGDVIYNLDDEGNTVSGEDEMCRVIFRSGELVAIAENYSAEEADINGCYTCSQLFREGWRLVLTDIEQQIIEERKKAEWKPQDGDIIAFGYKAVGIFRNFEQSGFHRDYVTLSETTLVFDEGGWILDKLRPATEEEKQSLFHEMAKAGKRWNAEKKVVEDIPKPHEFKKGEPVLVRDNGCVWKIGVFTKMRADYFEYGAMTNGLDECGYHFCIPYNERTMHLLGTTEDYKEE